MISSKNASRYMSALSSMENNPLRPLGGMDVVVEVSVPQSCTQSIKFSPLSHTPLPHTAPMVTGTVVVVIPSEQSLGQLFEFSHESQTPFRSQVIMNGPGPPKSGCPFSFGVPVSV